MARDIVRLVPEPFALVRYIARQSWVSAYSPSLPVPDLEHVQSAFQRRAIAGDFGSTAPRLLRRMSTDVDRVLVDIASERHGVMRVGRGFVSLTPDHHRAFNGPYEPGGEVIAFGSEEHVDLFTAAVGRAAAALRSEGTLDRVVVLRFPFADRLETGEPVVRDRMAPPTLNALVQPYYTAFAEHGFSTLRLPDELAVSSADHLWGPAVDHFAEAAPLWWAGRLVGERRVAKAREHTEPVVVGEQSSDVEQLS